MYDGFENDAVAAEARWEVIGEAAAAGVRWVEAEAGTGSRYVVCATWLPELVREREAGPVLVSVVWPWQDCKIMQDDGFLHESYVAEHLTAGRSVSGRLHGGDLKALTMTIRHALGRVG